MNHRILAGAATALGALGLTTALAVSPSASPATAAPMHAPAARTTTSTVRAQSVPLPPYPLRCVVTATNVNYRRGPGTQYASYGQLARGFTFASDGGVINPRNRYQYWNNIERPGHADAYVDDAYVYCWLPHST
jgi:hypothetical protein